MANAENNCFASAPNDGKKNEKCADKCSFSADSESKRQKKQGKQRLGGAQKIIHDLEFGKRRHGVSYHLPPFVSDETAKIRQDLQIPPKPTMLTHIIRKRISRRSVGKHRLRCQSRAQKISLRKIVAEDPFLWKKTVAGSQKNINIQNTLSAIDAFVKYLLIEIGGGVGIRIQPCRSRRQTGKRTVRGQKQGRDHSRLNYGMPPCHSALFGIENGRIFGMEHYTEKLPYRADIQIRIRIECQQVFRLQKLFIRIEKRYQRRFSAAQKTAKLQNTAPFALPTDISAFAYGASALTDKEIKAISVFFTQRGNSGFRISKNRFIVLVLPFLTLRKIPENGKRNIFSAVRQIKILQFIENNTVLFLAV